MKELNLRAEVFLHEHTDVNLKCFCASEQLLHNISGVSHMGRNPRGFCSGQHRVTLLRLIFQFHCS